MPLVDDSLLLKTVSFLGLVGTKLSQFSSYLSGWSFPPLSWFCFQTFPCWNAPRLRCSTILFIYICLYADVFHTCISSFLLFSALLVPMILCTFHISAKMLKSIFSLTYANRLEKKSSETCLILKSSPCYQMLLPLVWWDICLISCSTLNISVISSGSSVKAYSKFQF